MAHTFQLIENLLTSIILSCETCIEEDHVRIEVLSSLSTSLKLINNYRLGRRSSKKHAVKQGVSSGKRSQHCVGDKENITPEKNCSRTEAASVLNKNSDPPARQRLFKDEAECSGTKKSPPEAPVHRQSLGSSAKNAQEKEQESSPTIAPTVVSPVPQLGLVVRLDGLFLPLHRSLFEENLNVGEDKKFIGDILSNIHQTEAPFLFSIQCDRNEVNDAVKALDLIGKSVPSQLSVEGERAETYVELPLSCFRKDKLKNLSFHITSTPLKNAQDNNRMVRLTGGKYLARLQTKDSSLLSVMLNVETFPVSASTFYMTVEKVADETFDISTEGSAVKADDSKSSKKETPITWSDEKRAQTSISWSDEEKAGPDLSLVQDDSKTSVEAEQSSEKEASPPSQTPLDPVPKYPQYLGCTGVPIIVTAPEEEQKARSRDIVELDSVPRLRAKDLLEGSLTSEEEDSVLEDISRLSAIEPSLGQLISAKAQVTDSDTDIEDDRRSLGDNMEVAEAGSYSEHFVTGRQLGEGGFGYVYTAMQRVTEQKVVVKFIDRLKMSATCWVEREIDGVEGEFPLEAVILRESQDCDFVIKMLGMYSNDHYIQLVMEDFSRVDLFVFLDETDFDEGLTCHIFRQVVMGVKFLYGQNILHRDLKDENVVINNQFRCKLIDFGSAAYIPEDGMFSTYSGTEEYRSPEAMNFSSYNGLSQEMWSLGVLLYTINYRENPYGPNSSRRQLRHIDLIPRPSRGLTNILLGLLDCSWKTRLSLDELLETPWLNQKINLTSYDWPENLVDISDSPIKKGKDHSHLHHSLTL